MPWHPPGLTNTQTEINFRLRNISLCFQSVLSLRVWTLTICWRRHKFSFWERLVTLESQRFEQNPDRVSLLENPFTKHNCKYGKGLIHLLCMSLNTPFPYSPLSIFLSPFNPPKKFQPSIYILLSNPIFFSFFSSFFFCIGATIPTCRDMKYLFHAGF